MEAAVVPMELVLGRVRAPGSVPAVLLEPVRALAALERVPG